MNANVMGVITCIVVSIIAAICKEAGSGFVLLGLAYVCFLLPDKE